MPNSYRIKTEVGINQNIQVKLEQEYDMLELLSLQIFQSDIYTRDCANYGVICGRVFCNRGLGLPNAKISVFIPLQPEDENDPLVTSIYPYTDIYTVNDDGYKYNLLPYTQSYSNHVPVGTFPDRIDNLNDESVIKVYDKYYKHVVRTNDSGDFMIVGAPLGQQTIFMQIDLSDIGEFSLTPQDLIRMGVATESQVDGTKFKFSENYSELPQIVTLAKTVQVSPFFGQKEVCNYNIARVDFDLTSEASIRIEPTAVFMGSLISSDTKRKVKKNCKTKSKLGFNCELVSGPGQIDAIRQTIFNDSEGKPVLEVANLENKGKVIDENGAWLTEVPMNMNYVYTNENGDKVISNDPKVGVPTVGKYRFKVKWNQSNKLSEENRRAYFLVPNVREYGWNDSDQNSDPVLLANAETFVELTDTTLPFNLISNVTSVENGVKLIKFQNLDSYKIFVNGVERPDYNDGIPLFKFDANTSVQIEFTRTDNTLPLEFSLEEIPKQKFLLEQSYAFSLSWDDYANPTAAIKCEDTFYEMHFNKVYTVSQFIDRFSSSIYTFNTIQIKNIQDDSCEGLVNKFPMNDTYYRVVFLYILLSALIMPILQYLLIVLTLVLHILGFIIGIINCVIIRFINVIIRIINKFFIKIINKIVRIVRKIQCKICDIVRAIKERSWLPFNIETPDFCNDGANYVRPIRCIKYIKNPFTNKGLPLILYTDDGCERCKCWSKEDWQNNVNEADQSGGVSEATTDDDVAASIVINCEACNDAPCEPCSIDFQLNCQSTQANIDNPEFIGAINCLQSCINSGTLNFQTGACISGNHSSITTVAYTNANGLTTNAGVVLTPTDNKCKSTITTTVADEQSPCSDCGNGSIDCELCGWDLVYPPLVVAPIAGNNSASSEYGQNNSQTTENIPGKYDTVIQSASNCSLAVNCSPEFLDIVNNPQNPGGCYELDSNPDSPNYGAPSISFDQETGYPYCVFLDLEPIKILNCPTAQGGVKFKFQYQAGCFNLISVPIKSFPDDLLSILEWSERVLINMAICLDVFSHSFSNSWINGTMYAFPFQNSTTFDNENDPQREYCNEIVYLHSGSNNFYYRSSPVAMSTNVEDVTDVNFKFIGKNPVKNNGFLGNNIKVANVRYLLTPTTILDLGPKVPYLQEITLNDDLDGYIVNTLKPTSTAEITDIINMYVLSRLLNPSWIKLLVRLLSPASLGFTVGNFFRNKRWGNGANLDLADFFPTVGDGDYSQMLNQHTQYGLQAFDNNSYNGLDIYFGTDNLFNPLAADLQGQPFFGIFFSGNTQDRDYITPRRTNWLTQATIPDLSTVTEVTYLPTKSQIVPMYQWDNEQGLSGPPGDPVESPIDTIFGNQDNDYETSNNSYSSGGYFKQYYQKLDRADELSISKYMNNGNTNLELRKGWLINITQTDSTDPERPDTQEDLMTIGSPYHFYFGSIPGATALDLFFIKYVDTEEILL
jgi:hypothetical protein